MASDRDPATFAAQMSDGQLINYFVEVFRGMDGWDVAAYMYGAYGAPAVFAPDTREALLNLARLVARDVMASIDAEEAGDV